MKTGIKLLAGIAVGAAAVFLYLKYKKTTVQNASAPGNDKPGISNNNIGISESGVPVKPVLTPGIGANAVIKDPILNTASVKKNNINYGGTIINGYVDGVNPNLVIKDEAAYIRNAVAAGNVIKHNPNGGGKSIR